MEAVKSDKPRLSRGAILTVDDLGSEEVFIPKWGGYVTVRGMSAGERSRFAKLFSDEDMPDDAQAMLAQMCTVDADGEPMFTADDIPALSAKSPEALETIASVVMRLSGMSQSIEDAEKN